MAASFFDYSGVISTAAKASDYHRALGLFQRSRDGRSSACVWICCRVCLYEGLVLCFEQSEFIDFEACS
jgi:hypothetical protein